MQAEPRDTQRYFAAGFYAGLRTAGLRIIPGLTIKDYQTMLSRAKAETILQTQTAAAQKTYAAVPVSEPWTVNKIVSEMHRAGHGADFKVIGGCLNSLISAGLVKELSKGEFLRAPIREMPLPAAEPETVTFTEEKSMPKKSPTPALADESKSAKKSAIETLADMSLQIQALSGQLQSLARAVADNAIEIEIEIEAYRANSAKLQQLQTLLKSIGAE